MGVEVPVDIQDLDLTALATDLARTACSKFEVESVESLTSMAKRVGTVVSTELGPVLINTIKNPDAAKGEPPYLAQVTELSSKRSHLRAPILTIPINSPDNLKITYSPDGSRILVDDASGNAGGQVVEINVRRDGAKSVIEEIARFEYSPPGDSLLVPQHRQSEIIPLGDDEIAIFEGALDTYTLKIFSTDALKEHQAGKGPVRDLVERHTTASLPDTDLEFEIPNHQLLGHLRVDSENAFADIFLFAVLDSSGQIQSFKVRALVSNDEASALKELGLDECPIDSELHMHSLGDFEFMLGDNTPLPEIAVSSIDNTSLLLALEPGRSIGFSDASCSRCKSKEVLYANSEVPVLQTLSPDGKIAAVAISQEVGADGSEEYSTSIMLVDMTSAEDHGVELLQISIPELVKRFASELDNKLANDMIVSISFDRDNSLVVAFSNDVIRINLRELRV